MLAATLPLLHAWRPQLPHQCFRTPALDDLASTSQLRSIGAEPAAHSGEVCCSVPGQRHRTELLTPSRMRQARQAHPSNRGKGWALSTAACLGSATGASSHSPVARGRRRRAELAPRALISRTRRRRLATGAGGSSGGAGVSEGGAAYGARAGGLSQGNMVPKGRAAIPAATPQHAVNMLWGMSDSACSSALSQMLHRCTQACTTCAQKSQALPRSPL